MTLLFRKLSIPHHRQYLPLAYGFAAAGKLPGDFLFLASQKFLVFLVKVELWKRQVVSELFRRWLVAFRKLEERQRSRRHWYKHHHGDVKKRILLLLSVPSVAQRPFF